MKRDYLEPDNGNAADLLTAAAMATMFFTPAGGKVFSGAWKALKGGATTGGKVIKWSGEKALAAVNRFGLEGVQRVATEAYGAVKSTAFRAAKTADFMNKHRGVVTKVALGGAALVGGAVAIDSRQGDGPESYVNFDEGLPADNLGATGDLTLALHNRRRR